MRMHTSFLNTYSFTQNELRKINLVSNLSLGSYLSFPMIIWLIEVFWRKLRKVKNKKKMSKKSFFTFFNALNSIMHEKLIGLEIIILNTSSTSWSHKNIISLNYGVL